MVYQHHRHNMHALVPVGDFLLQAAGWTGRPPASLLSVFDGLLAGVERGGARDAARRSTRCARTTTHAPCSCPDGDAADVLARLRARVPEVGEYIDAVHFRLLDGFDLPNPTIGERPEVLVGRLRTALDVDVDDALRRSDATRRRDPRRPCPTSTRRRSTTCWPKPGSSTACATSAASTARSRRSGSCGSPCSSWVAASSERGRVHEPDDVLEVDAEEIGGAVRRRRRAHRRRAAASGPSTASSAPSPGRPATSARRRRPRRRSTCSRRRWPG